jgi:hypothetical protein
MAKQGRWRCFSSGRGRWTRGTRRSAARSTSAASAAPCWSPTRWLWRSPPWPWWWLPGRWWFGSAAPRAWNASSCAGWRWRPRWWCRRRSPSWAAWRWVPRPCSAWRPVPAWRSCRWQSARRSCATGCMTWTASSAAPSPTGSLRCCWVAATPAWSWGSASCSAGSRAWWSPARPWRWPPCSSRPAAASSGRWTVALTGAATTPPRRSRASAPGCASRSTWTPSPPSCWRWSIKPCSQPQVSLWLRPTTAPQGVPSTASSAQRQGAHEPRH